MVLTAKTSWNPCAMQKPTPDATVLETLGEYLFILTLTQENKVEIFEDALSMLTESQRDASFILQNLNRWDPAAASLFTQRSVSTILETPFRLVFPRSSLPSLDESGRYVRQYMAVSYCWRSDDFLPDGHERYDSWPISKRFVEAVLNERDHPRVGIWMDQLCIDQKSSFDKQSSVAAMDIIYRSCIRLLVLLEDVSLDEQEVALHEKYDPSETRFDRAWIPPTEERPAFASFYRKVTAARWWDRAWCFHEFNVNDPWIDKRQCYRIHNATFITNGPRGSTVHIKWWTIQIILSTALRSVPGLTSKVTTEKEEAILLGSEFRIDRKIAWRSSFMAKHNGVAQKGCLHLTDRLSIMINMCGLGLAYRGHALKSREEVLYFSALLALAAGEVYPLTMFHGNKVVRLDNALTWLQQHFTADDTTIPKFKFGILHGIHRISMHEIELDMIFLAAPLLWNDIRDEDLGPTYEIFRETIATTVPGSLVPGGQMMGWDEPDQSREKARRRFLAGCLRHGYSFTARLWAQLKRDVIEPNYNVEIFKDLTANPLLIDAARSFVAQLLPTSTLLGIPLPSDFNLEDAHLFLTWLTDPRSVYYISIYTYLVQCTTDDQGAFITAMQVSDEHWQDGPAEEIHAAIPTDLLSATCIPFKVWLLRPVKGNKKESKWRIVGKAVLLGEPDLMSEALSSKGRHDAVVELRERVVVGG